MIKLVAPSGSKIVGVIERTKVVWGVEGFSEDMGELQPEYVGTCRQYGGESEAVYRGNSFLVVDENDKAWRADECRRI